MVFEVSPKFAVPATEILVAAMLPPKVASAPERTCRSEILLVDPISDSKETVPEALTVPFPLDEPLITPVTTEPFPSDNVEPLSIVTAPVISPEVVVRVEDDPRVMVVASRLLDPAVRVFEAARVISFKELEFVPTFPARVLFSVKAAVPTPSDAP